MRKYRSTLWAFCRLSRLSLSKHFALLSPVRRAYKGFLFLFFSLKNVISKALLSFTSDIYHYFLGRTSKRPKDLTVASSLRCPHCLTMDLLVLGACESTALASKGRFCKRRLQVLCIATGPPVPSQWQWTRPMRTPNSLPQVPHKETLMIFAVPV